MKKIGISTVYTGYNYGSALQAYATKMFLRTMGYKGELISLKGSLVPGRDIRLKKLIVMASRFILHPVKMKKRAAAYRSSVTVEYSELTKKLFDEFKNDVLCPVAYDWKTLKKIAVSDEYNAFLCGSDQIWNGDTLYVDPQYYLRYAPKIKRIAFAPSFGREKIADYNEHVIKKYISDINYLSTREEIGVKIIKSLIGKKATHLLDPTLMISGETWCEEFGIDDNSIISDKKYILAYFLNAPSKKAKDFMKSLAKNKDILIIAIPYDREKEDWFDMTYSAGPKEFLKLIKQAEYVCTDSFHGTAFSINLHTPYYTFEREYGNSEKQSSRIESLLKLVKQEERFEPVLEGKIDFSYSELILKAEREKAIQYLNIALQEIEKAYE